MPTIPLKVKIRAQLLREEFGYSFAHVAKRCGVAKSSVFYWTKFSDRPRSNTKRGPMGLHHFIADVIYVAVLEQPLTTAATLRDIIVAKLQIEVSLSTIYKSLRILKMSHKSASRSREHQPVKHNHASIGLSRRCASGRRTGRKLAGLRNEERPPVYIRPNKQT